MNNQEKKIESGAGQLFSIVFAEKDEDKTEEKAKAMANQISGAKGILLFKDDKTGKESWGVLVKK